MTTVAEPHVDIFPTHPLLVMVQMADGSLRALAATGDDGGHRASRRTVRIEAGDLRATCRKAVAARAEAAARGDEVSVLVDLEVMIDQDARTARQTLAALDRPRRTQTLRYVGTGAGLAGLIADIHALQLADGVTLLPLTDRVLDLIVADAVSHLHALGITTAGQPGPTAPQDADPGR